jgi:NADH-quinone oxidoreductase subunit M
LPDLQPREWALVVPIVALVILMGVLPNLFLRPTEASVQRIVNRVREAAPVEIRADRAAPVEIEADGHHVLIP